MRSVILVLLSFISFSSNAQKLVSNKDENTLLWEVSGKGLSKPSYIFGTFHIMCKDDILISEQLKKALATSDKVYFELDMDDMSMLLSALSLMSMKDGKQLKDLYTEAEYKKVENFFNDSVGLPFAALQKVKPFFLSALLYPKMMSCREASGVEEVLVKLAQENKKDIEGLETMQQQAAVFDSIPYDVQAKELLKSIDSIEVYRMQMDTMVSAYKSQQLKEIERVLNQSDFVSSEENQDVLLYDRNRNWVVQLKEIMKTQGVFVAVGAGHLIGNKGLISLLRKEGYTVRPLLNK